MLLSRLFFLSLTECVVKKRNSYPSRLFHFGLSESLSSFSFHLRHRFFLRSSAGLPFPSIIIIIMKFFSTLPLVLLATNGVLAAPFSSTQSQIARRENELAQVKELVDVLEALSRRDHVDDLVARGELSEVDARAINFGKLFGIAGTVGSILGGVIPLLKGNQQKREVDEVFVRDLINELDARKINFGSIFNAVSSGLGILSGVGAIGSLFGNKQRRDVADDLALLLSLAGKN